MKRYLQSVCQLVLLCFCCVLITVRQSDGAFVPGRCLCPQTQPRVRGQLKDLTVFPKSPSCNKVTVIVTLRSNNMRVCLNPEAPMGKQLTRCWKRAHKLGRDVKVCLKRLRRRALKGQQPRQRKRSHKRKALSSDTA